MDNTPTNTENTSLRPPPNGYESMTTFQLATDFKICK